MALTKIGKEGITGISNSSDATFLTATSSEGVTLAGTLAVTGIHTVGTLTYCCIYSTVRLNLNNKHVIFKNVLCEHTA